MPFIYGLKLVAIMATTATALKIMQIKDNKYYESKRYHMILKTMKVNKKN